MPHTSSPPLLATKLFLPCLRQGLVLRPRLVQLLEAALTHPLTLVAAWGQQQPLPVAWLSLDI